MKRMVLIVPAIVLVLTVMLNLTVQADDVSDLQKRIIDVFDVAGADPSEEKLLEELSEKDPAQGALWSRIVDYWHYANEDMEVFEEKLPDDLAKDDSLCIVVLGFELNDDGTMQDELLGRLKTALSCANQYPQAYVVCTGGGTARKNPDVTEAGLMGEWLLSQGLDPDRLIIEDQSFTTAQNALFTYEILLDQYPQVHDIVVVSSLYHIAWGSLLLEASFMKAAAEQGTPEIHVVSNCAYPILNPKYADTLRFEKGGMMQLIGDDSRAKEYYRGY